MHGEPTNIDLFLIGINPATAILPDSVDINSWIETIMDNNLYDKRHSSNGPTRIGIRELLKYIKRYYVDSLLETNICAYPTSKAEDLSQPLIKDLVKEGEARFIKVFKAHQPSLIILHGQHTTKKFIDILIDEGWISPRRVRKGMPIKSRENQFPHFTFEYPSGKTGKVFACRHLKLFGYKGDSFKVFLNGLTPFLKTN